MACIESSVLPWLIMNSYIIKCAKPNLQLILACFTMKGYALGEHGYWEKKSNFDLTIRVPLIIHVPGITDRDDYNGKTDELFDLVDVFPTLSALAGLSQPIDIDGMDLSSIVQKGGSHYKANVRSAAASTNISHRNAAYHQFPACGASSYNSTRRACNYVKASDFDFMGYSIRTHKWRYTAWYSWDGVNLVADWDGDYADELYDHSGDDSSDLGKWEQDNLSAKLPDVARDLRSKLEAFFRKKEEDANTSTWDDGVSSIL